MGIERFYNQDIYVYSGVVTGGGDPAYTAIAGAPFAASATELSGNKAIIGGAVEVRADMMFCMESNSSISTANKLKWDSLPWDIVHVKFIHEFGGHHMEIYCTRAPALVLP